MAASDIQSAVTPAALHPNPALLVLPCPVFESNGGIDYGKVDGGGDGLTDVGMVYVWLVVIGTLPSPQA